MITRLSCSLAGVNEFVRITPGTRAHQCYSKDSSEEQFACNYGFNPIYRDQVIRGPLTVTGVDDDGAVRIVEIPELRFFMATLFVPQMLSTPESPHPLVTGFVKAAMEFNEDQK